MKAGKLTSLVDKMNANFWFVPSLMSLASFFLLAATLYLDIRLDEEDIVIHWLVTSSSEGARQLLSALVTALITVVGIVFSVTLVSLTVASTQYGPHVLRTYMKDKIDQVTLGVFISTFLYSLITLRMIRGIGEGAFIPHISIAVCLAMALFSVGFLIFFIHHMVDCIRVEKILRRLGNQFVCSVERFYSRGDDEKKAASLPAPELRGAEREVFSRHDGFITAVDQGMLLENAEKRDAVIEVKVRAGDFVFKGQVLASVRAEKPVPEECTRHLEGAFAIDSNRTSYQDILFSVEQIVEIALRALSPSMNEPFVGNLCINYLGAGLAVLLQREAPSGRIASEGRTRLVMKTLGCGSVINGCFHQIRQHSAKHPAVSGHLLGTIAKLAPYIANEEQRRILWEHAALIREGCMRKLPAETDRRYVEEAYLKTVSALGTGSRLISKDTPAIPSPS